MVKTIWFMQKRQVRKNMKPIVSFDVDMTLLDHKDWTIPDSAMETLQKLRENYTIVLATGRDMDSSFSVVLKEQIRPDAIIHLNGDVYKRQGRRPPVPQSVGTALSPHPSTVECQGHFWLVSYTHLDVYKRQHRCCPPCGSSDWWIDTGSPWPAKCCHTPIAGKWGHISDF